MSEYITELQNSKEHWFIKHQKVLSA